MSAPHLLLLGGTAEARRLAHRLAALPLRLSVSLAGATQKAAAYPGRLRVGGFGGAEGLERWLRQQEVSLLADATHPFAADITANAVKAARRAGCPYLRLERPEWQAEPGEDWRPFPTLEAALAALPTGARALLTTGSGSAPALALREDVTLFLRSIEPLENLPEHVSPILARPPFSEADERALLRARAITHLVTKNSGGAGRGKLDAAAALGLPVLMIARPAPPEGAAPLPDIDAVLEAVLSRLALDTASGRAP